jgi:hypothetical protein
MKICDYDKVAYDWQPTVTEWGEFCSPECADLQAEEGELSPDEQEELRVDMAIDNEREKDIQ